ncbi:MAG: type IV secretory system conjugative DNA transfer family protein [Rhodospirillaceae bacterium]|nr:type IV secretory system conjugative DNA transfer family protein [Rhodospirillaceae bacterium]
MATSDNSAGSWDRPDPLLDAGAVLNDLPRGVKSRKYLGAHLAPFSTFIDPAKLAEREVFRHGPSKVFLGAVGGTVEERNGEFHVAGGQAIGVGDDRHVVLCAGSRAGKGRSCLIPTLLTYVGSALVLDPKGELANVTARRRSEMGQRVCVVDPFEICAERLTPFRAGFNPMKLLGAERPTLVADAALIADALVVVDGGNDRDPHWNDSARNFIEGLIVHVATWEGYEGQRTLVTVRDLITRGATCYDSAEGKTVEGMPGLRREMAANAAVLEALAGVEGDPAQARRLAQLAALIAAATVDFFEKPDREQDSVLSTARRHTKFLDYGQLRDSLAPEVAQERFALTDLKTVLTGVTVYLCLPAGRMSACNRWFRLFINLALEAMEREKTKPKIPVLAMLEEFHILGHMKQLEVAAALVAGFRMKLLIVLQDLTQLQRHYRDGWETFLGNAGLCAFFGNADATTLKYVSERCGTTSIQVNRSNEVTFGQRDTGAIGQNWSLEVHPLLTAEEVCRYFGRDSGEQRQLILRPGIRPIVIRRVKYDSHELFRGMFDAPD